MPSFDVISEVDKHELTNAVDTANRELSNRFDFKGSDARFELDGFVVTQRAPSDFQLKQMLDILRARLIARGIDVRCLDVAEPEVNLAGARQKVTIKQGIEQTLAKKIVKDIKDSKLKVQVSIQGDELRVDLAEGCRVEGDAARIEAARLLELTLVERSLEDLGAVVLDARAPGGRPISQFEAGVRVAGTSRVIRVSGPRRWKRRLGLLPSIGSPEPVTFVPVVYSRAYGGVDREHPDSFWPANPTGLGFSDSLPHDGLPLPQIEWAESAAAGDFDGDGQKDAIAIIRPVAAERKPGSSTGEVVFFRGGEGARIVAMGPSRDRPRWHHRSPVRAPARPAGSPGAASLGTRPRRAQALTGDAGGPHRLAARGSHRPPSGRIVAACPCAGGW